MGNTLLLNIFVVWLFSRLVRSNSLSTSMTIAHQALLSMGLPRQEYWSGLPFSSSEDSPGPGIKPMPPAHISCLAGGFFTDESPGKPPLNILLFVHSPVNLHIVCFQCEIIMRKL